MFNVLLAADRHQIARLYRMLRAQLWLILLLALVVEWWLAERAAQLVYPLMVIALVGFWLLTASRWQRHWRCQLWVDLALLLAFLGGHGGGANPLFTLLLLPLAAAAATLGFWHWAALVMAAGGGYALALLGADPAAATAHAHHAAPSASHLWGMWGSFMLAAGLTGLFINRLAFYVRHQGERLRELHLRQGRHAMVTASGASAAAACHHLATPLNNLLLLHEHWSQQADLPSQWRDDLEEMGRQLEGCSQALAPLRLNGNNGQPQPLNRRLQGVVDEWQLLNPGCGCELDGVAALAHLPLWWPEDGLLHHALWNLMDNGARAGGPLVLSVAVAADRLLMTVADCGPGFPHWLLADQPAEVPPAGMGLGIVLVRTAMELCGGQLSLANETEGGRACLNLPVGYFSLEASGGVVAG